MQTIAHPDELRAEVAERRRQGQRISLVPTMGNLHAGHHSLVAIAREHSECVVASVFVNPTQFAPTEDFARYPRTPDADKQALAEQGCDLLFIPAVETMYPFGAEHAVRVSVPALAGILEGASRPGHFDGVATIVAKLFNFVLPDLAVFGRKDFQQLLVIRTMVRDLGFPLRIIGAPIIREASGLAMSSRNQFLLAGQREQACAIHATLQWMAAQVAAHAQSFVGIEKAASKRLADAGLQPDYVVLRCADDLGTPMPDQRTRIVALVAARLGSVRLIDNFEIE